MKNLMLLLIIPLMISCKSYDYVVESDYSYRGKFNKYKTFGFGENQSFAGVLNDQEIIEKSLGSTLKAWGYRQNERKPDLFVIYSLYFDDLKLRGYNQPSFKTWAQQNFKKDQIAIASDTLDRSDNGSQLTSLGEEYNEKNLDLTEGTLLVSFFDRKRNQTVWQGYASGVYGDNKQRNDRIVRSAIVQIMDEYKILAFQK